MYTGNKKLPETTLLPSDPEGAEMVVEGESLSSKKKLLKKLGVNALFVKLTLSVSVWAFTRKFISPVNVP